MRRTWQYILDEIRRALGDVVPGGVWRGRAPERTPRPYLVWRRLEDTSERALAGPVGVGRGTYEVRIVATDGERAELIADALRRRLDGFRSALADRDVLGVFLAEIADDDEVDEASPDQITSARLSVTVWYRERQQEVA